MFFGLLQAGDLPAQDRRGAGRERSERRTPRVEKGEVQRTTRRYNRTSDDERRGVPRISRAWRGRPQDQGAGSGRSVTRDRFPIAQEAQERRERSSASGRPAQEGRGGYHELFGTVQQGLASGSTGTFSSHLAPQVYVNLRGGESGYYSANQAHYVLENYFKTRRLVNVKFSTIGESDANPYATGSATFVERGTRSLAQVYVSLTRSGERWIITQINIY
jgi:hypothetical protein